MKVEYGTHDVNQNVDKEKTAYGNFCHTDAARTAGRTEGYTIDISGTVMDDAAYGRENLQSTKDIMQDAGQRDVALQRNYMAVMSNSMSTEDFAKLQQEGYSPANTEIETQVTIVDEIKATLAESGVVIKGYNDDLSEEQLKEIVGNVTRAGQIEDALKQNNLPVTEQNVQQMNEVMEKAENIKPLSDDAVKYLLNNHLEPTIENIYKAEYSTVKENSRQAKGYYQDGVNGYYAKKADTVNFDQIQKQVSAIIEKAGLSVNEQTLSSAKWIVEAGIPLTEETLYRVNELKELSIPINESELLKTMANAVADGKSPMQASLIQNESIAEKAVRLVEDIGAISEEAVEITVHNKEELTIRNLKKNEEQLQQSTNGNYSADNSISAKRLLEETRLQMTVEANLKLLKKGISIDTTSLEKLVEELKIAEQQYYRPLLGNTDEMEDSEATGLSDRISLYKQTTALLGQIGSIPAAILGKIGLTKDSLTLSKIYEDGSELKSTYEKAEKTYEALMTAPRADMGDSIKKAFQNVNVLLEEMGYEVNEANQRAVRILGYSGTEITQKSFEAVRAADQVVANVIEKMTPAKTLQMIRDGQNPIDTNIYELSEQLNESNEENEAEKYSEFLWKLEKNDTISEDERTAFIGVYRLFRQIEKSDGKLIGDVLHRKEELTLQNLLAALRTNKASGMDISVDESFGRIKDLIRTGMSITDQISAGYGNQEQLADEQKYYTSLSKEIFDKMTPENLQKCSNSMDISLETFAEEIRQTADKKTYDKEMLQEQIADVRKAAEVEDNVISALQNAEQPITVNNLLAADVLMNMRGSVFENIMRQLNGGKESRKEAMEDAMKSVQEGLASKEEAGDAYENMKATAQHMLSDHMQESENAIDVREMMLYCKQLSVATGFSKNENYEIPIQIDGEWTSINLKIIRKTERSGTVSATMQTEQYGKIAAKFSVSAKQINGYITGDMKAGLDALSKKEDDIRTAIAGDDKTVRELDFIPAKSLDLNSFTKEQSDNTIKTPMKDLYNVAKAFITVLQQKGENIHEN